MFDGSKSRVERAAKHIEELKQRFVQIEEQGLHSIEVRTEGQSKLEVYIHFDEHLPNDLALIISDAMHQLRSALDHLLWELLQIDGGTQDRAAQFPTGTNSAEYVKSCNLIKTPRQDLSLIHI